MPERERTGAVGRTPTYKLLGKLRFSPCWNSIYVSSAFFNTAPTQGRPVFTAANNHPN